MKDPEERFSPFDIANGAAEKLSPSPDFDGPTKNRRITDPLCLLTLLCIWGVSTWIGVWSLQKGDHNIFIHTVDYKGRICGFDKDENGDKLPPLLHPVDHLSNGKCVSECPSQSNLEPTSISDLICKDETDLSAMGGCLSGAEISSDLNTLITCGGCMYSMGVKKIKNQCVSNSVESIINKVNEAAQMQGLESLTEWTRFNLRSYLTRLFYDLHTGFYVLLGGLGGSALIGFLTLVLHLYPNYIAFTVWASAISVPLGFGGGGAFLWFLSSTYEEDQSGIHSEFGTFAPKILTYVMWSLAGVFLVSLVVLRQKITLSIALTKAGTRAIREIKMCVLFPILQFVFYTIFLGIMAVWFINFSTTGVFVEKTESVFGYDITYTVQKFSTVAQYKFWYLVFVLAWTSSFFITIGRLALSLCYARWYFTPEKDEGNSVSTWSCTLTTLVKHSGTAAFASLALGPIAVIRAPFSILQCCIRGSGMNNMCIDAIICSCQCSFFVMERFLKFSSRNIFTQTAVFGYSYCKSSHESYYLMKRNAESVSDAGPVGFLCTFYTRILLCSLTCLGSYFALDMFYADDLFSILSVTAVIGFISWFTVGFFTETVGMSVTTLFQCFLADEEMLGNEGSLYVPNEIDEFLTHLDASRKIQLGVPKEIGGKDEDNYTVDTGIQEDSMGSNETYPKMS